MQTSPSHSDLSGRIHVALFVLIISFTAGTAVAQQQVRGIVTDHGNNPLPGATVTLNDTDTFAVTDANGEFTLVAPHAPPFGMIIRSVGYAALEVEVYELSDELFEFSLAENSLLGEVTVTARRKTETLQEVPIAITVVGGARAEEAGAYNVNRLKELVPSVQLYSSNPRNTALNIRGLGSTFGLTNDGIDPGVGFYVDGVYYARPAATTLDFVDIERIEVLRGPQGTLFGKNTTAGAFNITTRKPSFKPGAVFEFGYGGYGFIQAKTSVTGPLGKRFAARVSVTGTQRDGTIYNIARDEWVNDQNNLGIRGQLLFAPTADVEITLAADASRQRPNGYSQVVAGIAPTLRAAYRQFDDITSDLGYSLPTMNPFDRKIDHDTPWRSNQNYGGVSLNTTIETSSGTITSTTAWRYWDWDPSNDRDFTGLQALALSQAPSTHHQWSQEVRYAGTISNRLSVVAGLFAFGQLLETNPYHTEESGRDQWRFSQNSTSELWQTPGLLDGYGIRTYSTLKTFSGAVFAQADWNVTDKLHVLPGVRLNYDDKRVDFRRETYGGLATEDPALIALKEVVYTDQAFSAGIDDINLSGQLTLSYRASTKANAFLTYASSYKPVGINLGGLPTSAGQPMLELASIKPERVRHLEAGIKTSPAPGSALNITIYNTNVDDYQTVVMNSQLGVNRGYLANAEEVRVRGGELDGTLKAGRFLTIYSSIAFADGKYLSFTNAPVPLEETGGEPLKDISGERLPGISKWSGSIGAEISSRAMTFFENEAKLFIALDAYYRSRFSSSPTPSKYLNVEGYALVNVRAGFRADKGLAFFLWARNIADTNYFEQLLPAAGNAGHYAGVLGDPRTWGVTLRYTLWYNALAGPHGSMQKE